MTNFQKLKHDARRAEQRSDWQRAIDLYRRALDFDPETVDLRIYNRIGDLHMRQGDAGAAVDCYEQAAERYAAQGMHTSAIALCNKALRIAPDRDTIHRQLGGLHAKTGLLAEGRRSCMIFVGRAIESGRLDEAREAVEEFATETGDEQIRLAYADALQSRGDTTAAIGQIRVVHDARQSRGSDASNLLGRIQQLDPDGDTDGEPRPVQPQPKAEQSPKTKETVNLAMLVAREIESMEGEFGFEAVRPVLSATDRGTSVADGLDGTRRLLGRFRSQLDDSFPNDDLTIRYDLGVELMTMGLIDEAIEEFQRAIQDSALVEAANTRIAECLVSRWSSAGDTDSSAILQRPPAAIPDVVSEDASDIEPEEVPEEVSGVAPDHEEKSDPDDGEQDIVVDDSDEIESHYFRARLAQYRIRRAEDRHTTDFGAHAELGSAYVEMDLLQEAVREFAVAVKGPRPIASRAARDLTRLGKSPATLPELAIHVVEILSKSSLDELADELARTLAESWGDDHPLAARLEVIRGDVARAAEELPSLESLFPGVGSPESDGEDLKELGELLSGLEQREPSDEIGEALRVDDEHIQVLKVAEAHRLGGRLEEAETVLYELLDQLQESRRPREAMTVVDRLLVLRPDDVVLYHQKTELALMVNDRKSLLAAYAQLGACFRRQGASRSARTAFGRILDFDPVNEEARAAIADIDREEVALETEATSNQSPKETTRTRASDAERSEFDAMLDDLGMESSEDLESIELEPKTEDASQDVEPTADANSHWELGLAFRQMGMWEEAVVEIRATLQQVDDKAKVLEALGECLHRLGDNEAAITELSSHLDDVEDDISVVGALYFLAQALHAEGRDSEARDTLSRVETVSPGYRDTAELLSELSL
jgi:tetratricopeptide (TPR) repeat protein